MLHLPEFIVSDFTQAIFKNTGEILDAVDLLLVILE